MFFKCRRSGEVYRWEEYFGNKCSRIRRFWWGSFWGVCWEGRCFDIVGMDYFFGYSGESIG